MVKEELEAIEKIFEKENVKVADMLQYDTQYGGSQTIDKGKASSFNPELI